VQHGVEVHAATLVGSGCLITTRPRSVPYKIAATQTYLLRRQSRKTLYLDGGRLLVSTTDWRFLCRPISSIPAVWHLSAGKSGLANRSSPGSPQEGGKTSRPRLLAASANWATYCTVEET